MFLKRLVVFFFTALLLSCQSAPNPKYLIILQAGTEGHEGMARAEYICDFCSRAFQVRDKLQGGKVPLSAEFQGHPSLVKWIKQGYTPLVL